MGNVLEKFGTIHICMAGIHYTKDTHHLANFNILLTCHNNLSVLMCIYKASIDYLHACHTLHFKVFLIIGDQGRCMASLFFYQKCTTDQCNSTYRMVVHTIMSLPHICWNWNYDLLGSELMLQWSLHYRMTSTLLC